MDLEDTKKRLAEVRRVEEGIAEIVSLHEKLRALHAIIKNLEAFLLKAENATDENILSLK